MPLLPPRDAVAELATLLRATLGENLLGLYLFGSLAAGGFVEGRSDVDLFAVLATRIDDLPALEALHAGFAERHPEWTERVEVGYVGRDVLQTFAGEPHGTIAAISPGEPLHLREPELGWLLNWRSVCAQGEVVQGPPPQELGPVVTDDAFRRAVAAQLGEWETYLRGYAFGLVPAARGYAVVTHCRALHSLATGGQASKEEAVEWVARRHPERAGYVRRALAEHRSRGEEEHRAAIEFAAWVRGQALGDGAVGRD